MEEKAKTEQKFCGNCSSHSAYNYPNQVFCTLRFSKGKEPVVQTLWCCEEWNPSSQECYCIKEVEKKQNKR